MYSKGYAVTFSESGKKECDTFTCCHCNRVTHIPHRASPTDCGGWCGQCAKPICKFCVGKDCMPLMKQIHIMESRQRLFREIGI